MININEQIFFVVAGIIAISMGVLFWLAFNARKKIQVLFGEDSGSGSSESVQTEIIRRISRAEVKLADLEPRLGVVEGISKTSVQKVGFLRFNPFQDTGGDQSFVLALLDRENNGVLISSLYTREGVRVYAKSIERGKSKHALSEEEQRVLGETIQKKLT